MGCLRLEHINGFSDFKRSPLQVVHKNAKFLKNQEKNHTQHYRYGFQGQEMDDEVKGKGNSLNFGARMHDPRVGRFFSTDAYEKKFAYQSPYVFAGNMPVWAMDNNGDSVLFYSESGDYLGYSSDNWRYKDQNLLVIIDANSVKAFNTKYAEYRALKPTADRSSEYIEAIVAGLEAMGTTFDVTEMVQFIKDYGDKVGPHRLKTKPAEKGYFSEQEWGAYLIKKQNPYYPEKDNWRVLDEESIQTSENNANISWEPPEPNHKYGTIHLHTGGLDLDPSGADWDKQAKVQSANYQLTSEWGVIIQENGLDEQKGTFYEIQFYRYNNPVIDPNGNDTPSGQVAWPTDTKKFKEKAK